MKKAIAVVVVIAVLGTLKIASDGTGKQSVGSNSSSVTSSSSSTSPATAQTPASSAGASSSQSQSSSSSYKDGTYTGSTAATPYGPVQIAVVVTSGRITNINFLQMPSEEENSRVVTGFAEPQLKQKAISAQSANIDFVSGATDTSIGFRSSLQAALDQAAG